MPDKPDVKAIVAAAKMKAQQQLAQKPDLEALTHRKAVPDPLASVEYGQGIEADTEHELSALLTGFKERAKQEQERFELATDSEFWFAVCFQSREQKEAFLQALEWLTLGDKYLDGTAIARLMGIELPKVSLSNKKVKPDPKLTKLTGDLEE